MSQSVILDGIQYEEGCPAHLDKIEQLHRLEIAKHTKEHVQNVSELRQLEAQTRVLNEELQHGARDRLAALSEANAAIQESEA